MDKNLLANSKNVKFVDLLQICTRYFGSPRISGSHHIFKMPWKGDPRINIQKDGNMAKEYQVKAVISAINRVEEENLRQGKSPTREGKNGKK